MSKVVLFGTGKIADVALAHLTHDSPHEVVGFTVDREYAHGAEHLGLPLVPFDEVARRFPPDEHRMFVAVGYHDLNRVRARKYEEAKAKGYALVSYVSSRASNVSGIEIGDNSFVLDGAVLQPGARLGSNVFFWCGNHLGHHASVGDHCYVAGQVVISGGARVEPFCFLGVNATIGHEVVIGAESFVGAATLVTKSAEPKSVFVTGDTPKFRLDSDSFLRLTKMR